MEEVKAEMVQRSMGEAVLGSIQGAAVKVLVATLM
jgi:hypothetical protein